MITFSRRTNCCVIGILGMLVLSNGTMGAEAPDPAAVLAPFVNDDTVAAICADAALLTAGDNPAAFLKLLPTVSKEAQPWLMGAMMINGVIHRFKEAGGQNLYVVGGLGDSYIGGGPVGVATAQLGRRPEEVEQMLRALIKELSSTGGQGALGAPDWPIDVLRKNDVVLVGTKRSLARYAALKSSPRGDLVDPLASLVHEGAAVAGVFCPGPDYRRVSRELWPALPGVLAPMKGELADRWLRIEVSVNPPPDAKPRITLVAKDAEAAEIFAKLWRDLPVAVTQFGDDDKAREMVRGYAQMLVDALPAKVEGLKVTIGLPTDELQVTKLRSMLSEAADKSMEASRRTERMNRFKQLALAMYNYESQNKHLPAAAAILDKNGKPLLSWRVALLPYLDQADLYNEFHLDEPWDSPHNRSLIGKMPEVFADPKLDRLAREGKTTYQVPTGPETMFFNNEGAKFSEITDGTANTIMIVEVNPEHAVEWTKPADWEVDLKNPIHGLERADRPFFSAAYADGSVRMHSATPEKAQQIRADLTRAAKDLSDQR